MRLKLPWLTHHVSLSEAWVALPKSADPTLYWTPAAGKEHRRSALLQNRKLNSSNAAPHPAWWCCLSQQYLYQKLSETTASRSAKLEPARRTREWYAWCQTRSEAKAPKTTDHRDPSDAMYNPSSEPDQVQQNNTSSRTAHKSLWNEKNRNDQWCLPPAPIWSLVQFPERCFM